MDFGPNLFDVQDPQIDRCFPFKSFQIFHPSGLKAVFDPSRYLDTHARDRLKCFFFHRFYSIRDLFLQPTHRVRSFLYARGLKGIFFIARCSPISRSISATFLFDIQGHTCHCNISRPKQLEVMPCF